MECPFIKIWRAASNFDGTSFKSGGSTCSFFNSEIRAMSSKVFKSSIGDDIWKECWTV